MKGEHIYAARLIWDGNTGAGTTDYASYGRQYRGLIEGKPDLPGSADPIFRGEAARHNPEDLFLISISSCHLLTYLALCARKGVRVLSYQDDAVGRMVFTPDGGGRFEEITLRPDVVVADAGSVAEAIRLHESAHELCFIARSCSVPIRHEATVRAEGSPSSTRAS